MLQGLTFEHARYPSTGRCCFCTREFGPEDLTDEHIIPLFLSGDQVLLNGSCTACAGQSNQAYESTASATSFRVYRVLGGLRRRRKGEKELLPAAPGKQLFADEAAFSLEMTTATRPHIFTMPSFPPPQWLQRRPDLAGGWRLAIVNFMSRAVEADAAQRSWVTRSGREHVDVRLFLNLEPPITVVDRHDLAATRLTIAKIGYCFAVGERGLDGFDGSDIRSLLRGDRTDIENFVGNPLEAVAELGRGTLHELSLVEVGGLLVARVHLFAGHGLTLYEVVVGRA